MINFIKFDSMALKNMDEEKIKSDDDNGIDRNRFYFISLNHYITPIESAILIVIKLLWHEPGS